MAVFFNNLPFRQYVVIGSPECGYIGYGWPLPRWPRRYRCRRYRCRRRRHICRCYVDPCTFLPFAEPRFSHCGGLPFGFDGPPFGFGGPPAIPFWE